MSQTEPKPGELRDAVREETMSALFAQMILQNTNMALMFLGQMPHPQSGEKLRDLEAARLFIDQLEMLEFKTRGNLGREEQQLLQQSLTHLRLSFFEVVEKPAGPETAPKKEAPDQPSPVSPPAVEADDESRKKFSKKY